MYSDISELPTQVRTALDDEDQRKWMDAYNREDPHSESEVRKARRKAWKACKDLPSSFSFCAVASVEDVDNDGEIIGVDSILKHAEDYIDAGGNLQDNHGNYTIGTCWDLEKAEVDGRPAVKMWGNVFGGDEVYDAARKAFIKGFNNVSIAGEADRGRFQCDDKGCYVKRNVKQLLEISLCKVPSNRHATMEWVNGNARLKKSDDGLHLNVESYTIHRDYTTCPILGLRKKLRDAGVDAHASEDKVIVPISAEAFAKSRGMLKDMGVWGEWRDGQAHLVPRERLIEQTFCEEYPKGTLTPEGRLLSMEHDRFCDLWSKQLIEERPDGFYLCRNRRLFHQSFKTYGAITRNQVHYGHR